MIQVIARAKAGGIFFTPADVFQNPTIATLAAVSRDDADLLPEQGMISGNVPLTPIQEWFFDHHRDHPEQFNTSMMLELFKPAEPEILEKTFVYLLNHHDALRSRFSRMDGIWEQYIEPSRETMEIQRIDLSGHPGSRQRKEIERLAALAQQDFKLNQVPLLKVIYFDLGSQNSHRLLIIFHHLVLDGVSWRIIIEDLIHIYGNLVQEKEIQLPQKTTSYKKWAEKLITYASGPVLETEHDYWKKFSEAASIALPFDFDEGSNTYGDTEDITLSFGIKDTRKLLQEVPQILKTQVNDVLLTALVRTLSPKQKLLVEMEGHGREDIFSGIDLSRTVGWFTSIFPVQLDVSTSRDIKAQIHSVHRQLDEIPYNGIGYNIIKYLSCKHNTKEIPGIPQPRINFNYLGQFDHIVPGSGDVPFRVAPEHGGNEQHPDEKRACDLYLVIVVSGKELHTRWLYSRMMFKKSTIKKLAGAYLSELKRIIRIVSEG
jgi:non-ribosomal peptide synthase protein (TIGR01720 family)